MTMLNKVLVLLARGFEETDVSTVTRALRRAGRSVAVVGLRAGAVQGAYGLSLAPDCPLSEVEMELPRAVVLPGGVQGTRRFAADPRVHRLLRRVIEQGGYVLAIDTAYSILLSAGVLDPGGCRSNGGPGEESADRPVFGRGPEMGFLRAADGLPSERVLVQGHVIFGRDSGSAQEAALTLASLLESEVRVGC
jgi:4-methyl-5(b-hydroxyethyl)-thiazole monophosphate biosynthesis